MFAPESPTSALHPEVEVRAVDADHRLTKTFASVFAGTDLEQWLHEREIDTVALVGYMTNNCVLGSAVGAEPLGFAVEVLSDATGAIDLSHDAGSAPAEQVHRTIMTLLHSNWAAVATTDEWIAAARAGQSLSPSDLVTSAGGRLSTGR